MFPLIAIAAFFVLGIAFFAIGKDDFGIKKIKEKPIDTSSKANAVVSQEKIPTNETTLDMETVNAESTTESESASKNPAKS